MEGVMLMRQARVAGLKVRAEGADLSIRGPVSEAALARELIAHKPQVMALLRVGALLRRLRARDRQYAGAFRAVIRD